jgi:hypothetical protein
MATQSIAIPVAVHTFAAFVFLRTATQVPFVPVPLGFDSYTTDAYNFK